ncbi:hypothetical protein [Aureimonas sp. SK2]|uniref:hypothetical protein n=1 Tax=Aureimonas sp. SK2 TaxID=3015992 RepID=UPI002443F7F4|nr:hypothetical protein [Aureimonas sp. SK2]
MTARPDTQTDAGPLPDHDTADSGGFERLAVGLTRWTTASESVFLDAGERLRTAHGRISQVREGIARATEIFTKPVMVGARDGLLVAVDKVATVQRLTEERGDRILALQAAVDKARSGSASLKTVFRVLDYIVVIARAQVESMKGAGGDLVSFSRTVDDLVTSGTSVAQAIDERMESLASAIQDSRAIAARRTRASEDWDLGDGFMALIERMEAEQGAAAARRAEAQEAFTAVGQAVAGAVMGLQAHDMARQRLEHTVENLGLIGPIGRDGTFGEGEAPLAPAHRQAAVRRIAQLEVAQLTDLAETYGGLMDKLAADLAAIADRLDLCADVLARLRMPDSEGGLAALEAAAERLHAYIEAGAEARRTLSDSLSRSVERTALLIEMTDQMTGLEFHLNLAGLNAAIQAAHVEGGDETIGYIARVIREQSSLARLEVDAIRSGSEEAASVTQDLSSRLLPEIAAAKETITANLRAACGDLAEAEAESRAALAKSAEASEGMSGEIRAVLQLMALHEEGTQMMLALSVAIGSLAAGTGGEALPAEEAARLDAVLTTRYTMKEERDVVARTFGTAAATPAPDAPAAAEPAADDFDDILF